MRQFTDALKVFTAANGTGVSKTVNVEDYNVISIALHGDASANLTVKVAGSNADDAPDFSATSTLTNSWDYVQCIDLQNGATINGSTGLVFTGAADNRNFECNVNGLKWVALRITTFSAGTLTAFIKAFSLN